MSSVPSFVAPSLVARVKAILLTPTAEWARIDGEAATVQGLHRRYALLLAAIPAVCKMIGSMVFGMVVPGLGYVIRTSPVEAVVGAVVGYVVGLVAIAGVAWLTNILAPSFGGQKNTVGAFKVVIYSCTPAWLTGVVLLLPMAFWPLSLVGLYGLFLYYKGVQAVMKSPPDKALVYTAVAFLILVVLSWVVMLTIMPMFAFGPALSAYGG